MEENRANDGERQIPDNIFETLNPVMSEVTIVSILVSYMNQYILFLKFCVWFLHSELIHSSILLHFLIRRRGCVRLWLRLCTFLGYRFFVRKGKKG